MFCCGVFRCEMKVVKGLCSQDGAASPAVLLGAVGDTAQLQLCPVGFVTVVTQVEWGE